MSTAKIRKEKIDAAISRSRELAKAKKLFNYDIDKQYELRQEDIRNDYFLTKEEQEEAIKSLTKIYDQKRVRYNKGKRKECTKCKKERLAEAYCEHCVRNYLEDQFKDWAENDNAIHNLIKICQRELIRPDLIVEWIPYKDLKDLKEVDKDDAYNSKVYTEDKSTWIDGKDGNPKIYTARWTEGRYNDWDSTENKLTRLGKEHEVILKELKNVDNANQHWLDEARSYVSISNNWENIVQCYGITKVPSSGKTTQNDSSNDIIEEPTNGIKEQEQSSKDPSSGTYMLVMNKMTCNLRTHLKKNRGLSWKERIQIIYDIVDALENIHHDKAVHKNLHPGNVLYSEHNKRFYVSDFGFCGPADRELESTYGNIRYIAPEVLHGEEYTSKSDIYSVAMLMWEISSGYPPFYDKKYNDYDLAKRIVNNGKRPKIVPGTLSDYEQLMKQCWDADPANRPDTYTLRLKIEKLNSYRVHMADFSKPKNSAKEEGDRLFNSAVKRVKTMFRRSSKYGSSDSLLTEGGALASNGVDLEKDPLDVPKELKNKEKEKTNGADKNDDDDDDDAIKPDVNKLSE